MDSQYDKACTTFAPSGAIPQIGYAKRAVEQGTIVVGARSKRYAVIAGYRRTEDKKFAQHIEKLYKIDDHCGCAIAGLTADARVLVDYMRLECLEAKYVWDRPMNVSRLVNQIGEKCQIKTIVDGRRPYGCGLVISGYNETTGRATIHETCPTGEYYEYIACAIGDRCTTAKTYLEKHYKTFEDLESKQLIKHVVKAIYTALNTDIEISTINIDVSIVGEGIPHKKLSAEELQPYLTECSTEVGGAPMEIVGEDTRGDGFS